MIEEFGIWGMLDYYMATLNFKVVVELVMSGGESQVLSIYN